MNDRLESEPRLAVLCATGSDRHERFDDGAGAVGRGGHPPVNYHAYAACLGGSFHRGLDTLRPDDDVVLLLLSRHLGLNLRLLRRLKASGRTVLVAFKETGFQQILERIGTPRRLRAMREVLALADGCLSPTRALAPVYAALTAAPVAAIPTPYPVDDPRWDFSRPEGSHRGIFVGTREFFNPTRNHLLSLVLLRQVAASTGEPVTVINTDGFRGDWILRSLGYPDGALRVLRGRRPYADYLREMAGHKAVFQMDQSTVPGQVAGDALLCRLPCVGGNGEIESIAFPELAAGAAEGARCLEAVTRLCRDEAWRRRCVEESQARARERVSFQAVAPQLRRFLATIRDRP